MAEGNGLNGNSGLNEASSSGGQNNTSQQDSDKTKQAEKAKTVPFYKLFSFADSTDMVLMITGTIAAIGNGLSLPIMTILFGELTDSFGQNQNNKDVLRVVSRVSLKFVYLALGCGVASFLQVACWMISGERQASRIRSLYLKTILQQDIAFYDKETNTGEVVGRMSGEW
uniref:Putative ovule protein n=1 Tax=Solanum chacoense TaxID=4108 RepID=A0A0V0HU45_SOLCH